MKIIGLLSGLVATVLLIPSLGLPVALILGSLFGGIIGFTLATLTKGSFALANKADERDTAEYQAVAQIRRQLENAKKIRVFTEAKYLADIVSRIEAGDAMACWNLGECYLHGRVFLSDPFPRNKKAALFWFRRSATMGLAYSQYHLGLIYLGRHAWELRQSYSEEDAIETDLSEALRWLVLAGNQSDTFGAFAQDVLGEMHFLGIGVDKDHAKAFDLFTKSLANPENTSAKMGIAFGTCERLSALRKDGYPRS